MQLTEFPLTVATWPPVQVSAQTYDALDDPSPDHWGAMPDGQLAVLWAKAAGATARPRATSAARPIVVNK
ncbi:MAG: hypothetical protein AMXMBFR42_08970 [Burkholderiales bacterium]